MPVPSRPRSRAWLSRDAVDSELDRSSREVAATTRRPWWFAMAIGGVAIAAVPSVPWTDRARAVTGVLMVGLAMVMSLVRPWNLRDRGLRLAPPLVALTAFVVLAAATDTRGASLLLVATVVPLGWLAIHEDLTVLIATGALLTLSVGAMTTGSELGAVVVALVCVAGSTAAMHDRGSRLRRLAWALREEHAAHGAAASMLDALPDPVSRYRVSDLTITYCNQAWARQYRTTADRAIGRPVSDFLSEDELAWMRAQLAILGPERPIIEDVVAREVAQSPGHWLHWIDRYMQHPTGDEILSIGRDVTARHHAEARLAASEAGYRDLADKSVDIVWRVQRAPTPHFDYVSPSVERLLGYPASYFLDDFGRVLQLLDHESIEMVKRAMNGEPVFERHDFHIRRLDGTTMIGETRTATVPGGLQGVTRDVTDLRELQASVAELALRDPLTGLANRRLLDELLDADLARAEASGQTLAVAFLDLDDFKQVNDLHGHEAGDVVLRETARRLIGVVDSTAAVARVGGDEFVIVLTPTEIGRSTLTERIDHALRAPIDVGGGHVVQCRASVGIARTDSVGFERSRLLASADRQMYEMKRARARSASCAR